MNENLLQEIRILEFQLAQQQKLLEQKFKMDLNDATRLPIQNLKAILANMELPAEKKLRKLEINILKLMSAVEKMS